MKVGVPKEVKNHEYRVAITPIGVHELTAHGHDVYVEKSAGLGSLIRDGEYEAAGAKIGALAAVRTHHEQRAAEHTDDRCGHPPGQRTARPRRPGLRGLGGLGGRHALRRVTRLRRPQRTEPAVGSRHHAD